MTFLAIDEEIAHVWGRLRVPNPENALDEQIAATALLTASIGADDAVVGCEGRDERNDHSIGRALQSKRDP